MNSSNLINPFALSEQRAWYRWLSFSRYVIGVIVFLLVLVSMNQWWNISCLHNDVKILQITSNTNVVQQQQKLYEQQEHFNQKMQKIKQWTQEDFYQDHITMISKTIPTKMMLTLLDFDGNDVVLRGETSEIEYLLAFLSSLEQSKLFQLMNLVDLQSSSVIYKKKNLVNFMIKGKLEGISFLSK